MKRRGSNLVVLVAATAISAGALGGCAAKSKEFKLEAPTKANRFLVTTVHVAPDGECAEVTDAAFKATGDYVAQAVAMALDARFIDADISAEYREPPADLPFLYQRRIFTVSDEESWVTYFPGGECPGFLEADPKVPAVAAPFPEIEFPDEWKIDAEAVLFIFVHTAGMAGPPPTDLIDDVVEDFSYISVIGFMLVDVVEGTFLGAGHRVDNSAEMMILNDGPVPEEAAALLFEGKKIMNQVLLQILQVQIGAIADEIGLQVTAEE